jgi:flagellar basal-body rod protein FlgC
MSINAIFDVAGTGMSAQSVRLNTVASNIANAQTASSSIDQTYRARVPVFQAIQQSMLDGFDDGGAAAGVRVLGIVESEAALEARYEPNHPQADDEGYVFYPNVNVVEQMADMISASRSFQINVEVMNAAKTMMQRVLSLGQ